jgi:hypothetical protein
LGGAVTDNSGAAVPDALVNLTDPEYGVTVTFYTETDGRYIFPALTASNYTLKIR